MHLILRRYEHVCVYVSVHAYVWDPQDHTAVVQIQVHNMHPHVRGYIHMCMYMHTSVDMHSRHAFSAPNDWAICTYLYVYWFVYQCMSVWFGIHTRRWAMFIYLCIDMCIRIDVRLYGLACSHACMSALRLAISHAHAHACIPTHTQTHIYIRTCIHACTNTPLFWLTCAGKHTYTHTYIHTCIHSNSCTYIHIHAHFSVICQYADYIFPTYPCDIHIHTNTHTHTYIFIHIFTCHVSSPITFFPHSTKSLTKRPSEWPT